MRIAEEDKRLSTHLVDRIVAGPGVNGDMWHGQRKLVYVLDPGGPTLVVRHGLSVGGAAPGPGAAGEMTGFKDGALPRITRIETALSQQRAKPAGALLIPPAA